MRQPRPLFVLVSFLMAVGPALAAIDMTGSYSGEIEVGPATFDCDISATQTGSTISITIQCLGLDIVTVDGTIDVVSGVFSATNPTCCGGGGASIDGTVAPDSASFAGIYVWAGIGNPLTAIRTGDSGVCGDGIVDPGEECDGAEFPASATCCTDVCTFVAVGTSCPSPSCRVRECNGAGACVQVALEPEGTSCGGSTCFFAECDDIGTCETVGVFACDGCSTCVEGNGCVGFPLGIGTGSGQCVPPSDNKSRLIGKTRSPDTKDLVVWKWAKGPLVDPVDFGNPLIDTDYQMCVFMHDPLLAGPRSIFAVDVPAGAGWKATRKGFKYNAGDTKIILSGGSDGKSKIKVRSKGLEANAAVDFRDYRQYYANGSELNELPPDDPNQMQAPIQVELRASNGQCWGVVLNEEVKKSDERIKVKP